MKSTDGLVRGTAAVDTGKPITVPVGEACLGRVFNLLGETVDDQGPVITEEQWPIHRNAPEYEEQVPATEILETGIKVVDLICPCLLYTSRRIKKKKKIKYERKDPVVGKSKPQDLFVCLDRKSTRLNSSHSRASRMPSSA